MPRHYLTSTVDATRILGFQLAAARRGQRRTSEEVSERAGISRPTLRRIERGDPTVAIGNVFEVAAVLAVPLFGAEGRQLAELAARGERELRLLPSRIDDRPDEVDDAF